MVTAAIQTIVGLVNGNLDTANLAASSVSPTQLQAQSVTAPKIGFTLGQVPPPVAAVTIGDRRLIGGVAPQALTDACTKAWVDAQVLRRPPCR